MPKAFPPGPKKKRYSRAMPFPNFLWGGEYPCPALVVLGVLHCTLITQPRSRQAHLQLVPRDDPGNEIAPYFRDVNKMKQRQHLVRV